jgi:hypothetical protein
VVGPRGAKSGEVEIKTRKGGAKEALPTDAGIAKLIDLVTTGRDLA